MAYVPVPKDLTKVKTKVALNLTKRQLIFFSLAAVVGIPFYETYNFSGGFRFYDAVVNDRALIERAYACGMDY